MRGLYERHQVLVPVLAATLALLAILVWSRGGWRWGQPGLGEETVCQLAGGQELNILGVVHHCAVSN
jgi:hypothetical protein